MSRPIDADKLLESLRKYYNSAQEWYDESTDDDIKLRAEQTIETLTKCILRVKAQPAADVQEVKHAHWENEYYDEITELYYHTCSNCNTEITETCFDNYCPNCGAKMDEEDGK